MMREAQGSFIAIEGGDGSGKGTQTDQLEARAKSEGIDVLRISFPRYGEHSAVFVGRYLDGKYGGIDEVHPELASLAYAIDRFAASALIKQHLAKKDALVLADRYVASNLAHQGAKLSDGTERQTFYDDILRLEYETLALPRPDINLVLLVPSEIAQQNVDKKAVRSYTAKTRDIHESDASHLEKAKANYQELCALYPDEFTAINCMADNDSMRSIEDIGADIWDIVSNRLKKG